jgi:pseudouridine synthase
MPRVESTSGERLHKVLAGAGFGSRRKCEQLIAAGQVTVDGRVVTAMGVRVDPLRNRITCAGQRLRTGRRLTVLLNKPRRVITSVQDERGRRTVMDLLRGFRERLFPVGRLDWDSQGLLLLTNDGDLANVLTHPRYGVPRTYHAIVKGDLTGEIVSRLQAGVWLSEGKTSPVRVLVKKRTREGAVLEVTLREGMNREVRRVFARFGLRVKRLKRIRVGPLGLGGLAEGRFRLLSRAEVEALRSCALAGRGAPAAPRRSAGGPREARGGEEE